MKSTTLIEDEKIWRSTEEGKRYQIDTETKEVTKGNIGVSNVGQTSESDALPTFETFAGRPENQGKTRSRQVFDYMMEHYVRGIKSIKNPAGYPEGAEVVFRRESAGKTANDLNEDKVKALPFIADVYRTGVLVNTKSDAKNHASKDRFIYSEKYIKEIGLKVTVCASRVAIDAKKSEYRHYLISKADKAEDEKRRGLEGGFCYPSRPDASKPLIFNSIVTKDTADSKQIFEFVDFSVEKVTADNQLKNTMNNQTQNTQRMTLSFDSASKRRFDENGFMHVESSHITKEQVVPYRGREIPGWEKQGLEPYRVYFGYRPADELMKAVETFNGLPVMLMHHAVSADNPKKEYQVGSMATNAIWNDPYIDNGMIFTDSVGIEAVKNGMCREISCAYQYDPDFTPGNFNGVPYDFVMRNIRGNHVAIVEEGRAGPDVVVADSSENLNPKGVKQLMSILKDFFRGAQDGALENGEEKVDAPKDVNITVDEDKNAKIQELVKQFAGALSPEDLKKLEDSLTDLAYSDASGESKIAQKIDGEDDRLNAAEAFKAGENDEIRKVEREKIPGGQDDSTTEIIAAGENHEREKLMQEHMRERAEDAIKQCGMDAEADEVKEAFAKGFAWGMHDGEKGMRDQAEREKLDREHEREAMEKRFAEDSAAMVKKIERAISDKFEAAKEVEGAIGSVRALAFDSADDIYRKAP